jgi:hypothetical protein
VKKILTDSCKANVSPVLLLNGTGTGFIFRKFFSFNEGAKKCNETFKNRYKEE